MQTLHEEHFVKDVITITDLVPFLSRRKEIDYETFTEDKLDAVLPPGWYCFKEEILHAAQVFKIKIGKIDIKHGMLRIYNTTDSELDDLLFKRYSENLRFAASKVCMMCGGYGWRRLDVNFRPILCKKHYLEFINIEEYYV